MFCFILQFALSHDQIPSATFTRVSVIRGIPAKVSLGGRTAVIADAPANSFLYSVTTSNGQTFQHSSPCPSRHLLVTAETLIVDALIRRLELSIWVLPEGVCSATSVVLSSDRFLAVKARLPTHADTMCFFSQTGFHQADLVVYIKSKDASATVAIHSSTSPTGRPGRLGEHCKANEQGPWLAWMWRQKTRESDRSVSENLISLPIGVRKFDRFTDRCQKI